MKKPNVRLTIPIGRPTEIKEMFIKSGRGQAVFSYAVRLEAGRKQKIEKLADKAGITAPELIRILLGAAINVELSELTGFIKSGFAARKEKAGGDLKAKFKKAKGREEKPEGGQKTKLEGAVE